MFHKFFKRHKKLNQHDVAVQLLTLIFNDDRLSKPIFIEGLISELDINNAKGLPLIYIWSRGNNHLCVSVNPESIAYLLEVLVSRDHPQFMAIRDEVAQAISKESSSAVMSTCEKLGVPPFIAFPTIRIENLLK